MSKVMRLRISTELERRYKNLRDCAVIGFKQLNATQASELRTTLRDSGLRLDVVKNACGRQAFKNLALQNVERLLDGPSGIVWGGADASHMAKLLFVWADKNKNIEVRGGLLQGGAITTEKMRGLAILPARGVLMGMVVSAVAAPLSKFVSAHAALLRKLVGCVQALKEKTEKTAPEKSPEVV